MANNIENSMTVINHDGVFVVRDDLFPGGTKARYIAVLFEGADEVVYASPCQGGAQCSLAFVARALGKRATIFVAKRKEMHRRTAEAKAMGAKIVEVDFGMLSNVQSKAKKYCEETGARLAPFGMEIAGAADIIAEIARGCGITPGQVWCAAGSGLLARGLRQAWPDASLNFVIVGGRKIEIAGATAWKYPKPFEATADQPPFPSDPHYDAKAWEVCQENFDPNEGHVLFWNVTGTTMLTGELSERALPEQAAVAAQKASPAAKKKAAKATPAAESTTTIDAPDRGTLEGYKVQLRHVNALRPYDRNARTHSDAQIEDIARLIDVYGWTNPILHDDVVRAGHGRRLAAMRIYARGGRIRLPNGSELPAGYVPVIDCTGWSEVQRRAYVLADNQSALTSGWDAELLGTEIADLRLMSGFSLGMTAFDDTSLGQVLDLAAPADPAAADPTMRDLDDADKARLLNAWRMLMSDWQGFMREYERLHYFSTNFTRGALAVYFVRAQLFGTNIPRAATTPFTGHRFFVPGSKLDIASAFTIAETDDALLASLMWQCQRRPAFDKMFGSLGIHGHRAPADFPATLAASLIDEFIGRKGGAVLDPCHGWGGRAIGFLLSKKAARYQGYDVDPQTATGVRAIVDYLAPLCLGSKTADLILQPFEDATIEPRSFDFALTSPPYFDVEKYDGADQSWRRYPTFEAWAAGFYQPMIETVADALRPGASFCLQIGNQSYPLEETAKRIAADCGLSHVETRTTDMVNNYTGTEASDGEIIMVLRKGK